MSEQSLVGEEPNFRRSLIAHGVYEINGVRTEIVAPSVFVDQVAHGLNLLGLAHNKVLTFSFPVGQSADGVQVGKLELLDEDQVWSRFRGKTCILRRINGDYMADGKKGA